MRFYLGTHKPQWLPRTTVPLFISRRRLEERVRLPRAAGRWALDSGGYTELSGFGEWRISERDYVREVGRYQREVGGLEWVAPMDWMCEPNVLAMTGLSVDEHQALTVANFVRLRAELGPLVVPVVQGWERDDYLRCVDRYARACVELDRERLVGVGSVCRRGSDAAIVRVLASLSAERLRLHAFGVRGSALADVAHLIESADSMAWSYRARRSDPLSGCTHARCNNCLVFATRWYEERVASVGLFYDREVSCVA